MKQQSMLKFLTAQKTDYESALTEIKAGRKQGHWMWYIFPQIAGLGVSSTSVYYAIADLQHATEYLEHPVLGPRLIEICEALLGVEQKTAREIMGSPDDLKLRSSMTLFSSVNGADNVFDRVLQKYFDGKPDNKTLDFLGKL
ncbi:MAG TPA: DUF1810 domain-containing protein [Dyadobacter sp.]|jgi:uncharacterized protein (DUF1810 family)|nr:DUF1810 domain-containing protein [Dyadobacter sp.]